MFERGNLTFWDIGNYLTIGFFFFSLFILYLILFFGIDITYLFSLTKDFSNLLIILLPIMFLAIGMIIDPLANFSVKSSEKIYFLRPKDNKYSKNLQFNCKKFIDKQNFDEGFSLFLYCKAVVELNIQDTKYDIYLARFGFYRNLCFLIFCLFFFNFIILNSSFINMLLNCILLPISWFFLKRAQIFKIHMENYIYYSYLALMTSSKDIRLNLC